LFNNLDEERKKKKKWDKAGEVSYIYGGGWAER